MLVLFLLVVLLLLPEYDVLPVPQHHEEIGIKQQDGLIFHLLFFQAYGRREWFLDRVRQKSRLNYCDTMLDCVIVEGVPVIG